MKAFRAFMAVCSRRRLHVCAVARMIMDPGRGRKWGRVLQSGQQRCDFSPVADDHGVGDPQFTADFSRAESVGETFKDGFFLRFEVTREEAHDFACADVGEHRIAGIGLFGDPFTGLGIERKLQTAFAAFAGIDAFAGGEIVLEMEAATLEVPTHGLARAPRLNEPQVQHGFLHEILAQGLVAGHFLDNPRERLAQSVQVGASAGVVVGGRRTHCL